MKSIFSFVLLVFFSNLFAFHKDKVKIKTFGNVKTLYISEFNFGEKIVSSEEFKMEVLGELSRQLAERMGFKDTVMLERKTYLYPNKKPVFIIEKNEVNYKFLKLAENFSDLKGGTGVAVRILSEKVSVEDVLKMVEFAIRNKNKLNKYLMKTDYYFDEDHKIQIPMNSEQFISGIVSKNSVLVNSLLQSEFLLFKNEEQIISWSQNEFIFKRNLEKLKLENVYREIWSDELRVKDFKYYVQNDAYRFFLVFTDEKTFSFYDGNSEHKALNVMLEKGSGFYPYSISMQVIKNKIIIYDRDNYFIYDIGKKKLQKIE